MSGALLIRSDHFELGGCWKLLVVWRGMVSDGRRSFVDGEVACFYQDMKYSRPFSNHVLKIECIIYIKHSFEVIQKIYPKD